MIILGFYQSVIEQEAMICGEVHQLLVLKGGVKNREQTPAESLMVLKLWFILGYVFRAVKDTGTKYEK